MNLFCFSLEGSMDSLYEVVQSSGDGPPPPVPSRSSSRTCSRSCSPALLLDQDSRWRDSGRSVSMELPQRTNSHRKKKRSNITKSASDNETLDNSTAWRPAKSPEDLLRVTNNHNQVTRARHRTEGKGGKGSRHSAVKKKDKPSINQTGQNNSSIEGRPAVKPAQKTGKKPTGKGGKDAAKKNHSARSPHPAPSPTTVPDYLDVQYRADRRPYKCSTLPAQENATPGRGPGPVNLPGGATPTHNYRWSNPGDGSPVWGSVQHTCRRPLTEYRVYSHDFIHEKDFEEKQTNDRDSLKRSCRLQMAPQTLSDGELSEQN